MTTYVIMKNIRSKSSKVREYFPYLVCFSRETAKQKTRELNARALKYNYRFELVKNTYKE